MIERGWLNSIAEIKAYTGWSEEKLFIFKEKGLPMKKIGNRWTAIVEDLDLWFREHEDFDLSSPSSPPEPPG